MSSNPNPALKESEEIKVEPVEEDDEYLNFYDDEKPRKKKGKKLHKFPHNRG